MFGDFFPVSETSVLDSYSAYVASVSTSGSGNSGTVTVESFDLLSGARQWSYSIADVIAKLTLVDGRLYLLGDSNLVAIDSKTGVVLWAQQITYSGVSWMFDLNIQFASEHLAYFTIYDADPSEVGPPPYDLPLSDEIAAVVALDPTTGERVWSARMPQTNYYWLSASADGSGFLFVGSQMYRLRDEEHKIIRFNAADGSRTWEHDIGETFDVLKSDSQIAVLAEDSDEEWTQFAVFNPGMGTEQIALPVDAEAWPILLTNDFVLFEYFGGDDLDRAEPRTLRAIDLDDGHELWTATPGGTAAYGLMQLAARNNSIFVLIGDSLSALDQDDGTVKWQEQVVVSDSPAKLLLTPVSLAVSHRGSMISIFEL